MERPAVEQMQPERGRRPYPSPGRYELRARLGTLISAPLTVTLTDGAGPRWPVRTASSVLPMLRSYLLPRLPMPVRGGTTRCRSR
jgi:hypothetical protein